MEDINACYANTCNGYVRTVRGGRLSVLQKGPAAARNQKKLKKEYKEKSKAMEKAMELLRIQRSELLLRVSMLEDEARAARSQLFKVKRAMNQSRDEARALKAVVRELRDRLIHEQMRNLTKERESNSENTTATFTAEKQQEENEGEYEEAQEEEEEVEEEKELKREKLANFVSKNVDTCLQRRPKSASAVPLNSSKKPFRKKQARPISALEDRGGWSGSGGDDYYDKLLQRDRAQIRRTIARQQQNH